MADAEFALKKAANKSLPVSLTLEHVSPVTRLLEKRKQMLQVQESLDSQKDEYGRKEELFKRREENLRKKDLELQEALVLFNRFLKENEQKRRRAEHRANDEIKKRVKWEKQIQAHKASVAALRDKCDRLQASVKRNEKYNNFLTNVQEQYAAHFDELGSIITRYATLKGTNIEMIKTQEELLDKNEKMRLQFNEYKKQQYNATLALNNDIASEARELEECVKRTAEVEEAMIQQELQESRNQRISTQIILATDNLYSRCKKYTKHNRRHGGRERLTAADKLRMDSVTILLEETKSKLDEVADYLSDFKDICKSIAPGFGEQKEEQQFSQQQQMQQGAAAAAAGGGEFRGFSSAAAAAAAGQGYGSSAGGRQRPQDEQRGSTGGHGSSDVYSSSQADSTT